MLRQRTGELQPRDRAARDKDLTQTLACSALGDERRLELLFVDETHVEEYLADFSVFLRAGLRRRRVNLDHSVRRGQCRNMVVESGPLLGERARQREAGDSETVDRDLSQQATVAGLNFEHLRELLAGNQLHLDKHRADEAKSCVPEPRSLPPYRQPHIRGIEGA